MYLLGNAIALLWLAWVLYWMLAARGVKTIAWRESRGATARHRVPLWIAIVLFFGPRWLPRPLRTPLVPHTAAFGAIAIAFVAAGLAFSVYARMALGRNWSGIVARKDDHTLVRTGPYRLVRHPIYTGLVVAFFGNALAVGELCSVLGFILAVAAIVLKLRAEEAVMQQTFPDYAQYRASTWALVPFVF